MQEAKPKSACKTYREKVYPDQLGTLKKTQKTPFAVLRPTPLKHAFLVSKYCINATPIRMPRPIPCDKRIAA